MAATGRLGEKASAPGLAGLEVHGESLGGPPNPECTLPSKSARMELNPTVGQ